MTDIHSPKRLVIVSAGTSQPSTTRMLADRIATASVDVLRELGMPATVSAIEIAPLATDVAAAAATGVPSEELKAAIAKVADADALICSTPIYNAGLSGLFKTFIDVLDGDLIVAKPVALAATAGSARHALVVDEQMRSLFAYLRALALPTAVFAAPDDWSSPELGERIRRVAIELGVLLEANVERRIADRAWSGYQHEFGGNATRAQQTSDDIDFDSPLMRLAAGGSIGETPGSD